MNKRASKNGRISFNDQLKGLRKEADDLKNGKTKLSDYRVYRLPEFDKKYSPRSIKRLRQKLGLSQRILGTALGASVTSVQAWESGTKKPSKQTRRLLDGIENVPAFRDYLFPSFV